MHHKELLAILRQECRDKEIEWFDKMASKGPNDKKQAFVMAHRFVGKDLLSTRTIRPQDGPYEVNLGHWTKDQLVRTVFLLSMNEGNEKDFVNTIEELFKTADSREAQAIYAAIPFFDFAPAWKPRAAEAIRSNVGLIFDAMAFNNPYPALYFDDAAWNQLVLKTIFTDKPIWNILGLEDRRNQALAVTISDFAHERWSAGRTLPAEVWFLTAPFPNEQYWKDAHRLLTSETKADQEAGYLLWKHHSSEAPGNFTETFSEIFTKLDQRNIRWKDINSSEDSN